MSGHTQESFPCGEAVVFTVRGEIDIANATQLCAALLHATDRSECQCLIVDLSKVQFIDLSGVRASTSAAGTDMGGASHGAGRTSAAAQRVLTALRMDRDFEIYPIVEAALVHTARQRYEEGPITGVCGCD